MSSQYLEQPQDIIPIEPPEWIPCPCCDREVNALKEFNTIHTLYFWIPFIAVKLEDVTACPGCMRVYLVKRLLVNLLASTLLFPVIVLPIFLFQYFRSWAKGHSSKVIDEYEEAYHKAIQRARWSLDDENEDN